MTHDALAAIAIELETCHHRPPRRPKVLVGRAAQATILRAVTDHPQTAKQLAEATGHTQKCVRWVMGTYSIPRTKTYPRRYYIESSCDARD